MLKLVFSVGTLLSLALFGAVFVNQPPASDDEQRKELWKQVQQAERQSLPKSAAATLQEIYDSAIADEDYPEAVRACARRYSIEGQINQPVAPYVIRKMSAEMENFPDQVRPVMKVILANWFFSYYSQNRWRFAQRSQTGQSPSEDFETWDLKRLLSQIDELFTDALASSDELKQIPISDYDELLDGGKVLDSHRPTLFDFIAFQALDFYSLDEQIVRKQGAFDLRADGPIFASTDQFLAWQAKSDSDEKSYLLRAIKIYQQLLEFHADDEDPTARLDADLHRLSFGNLAGVGSEKKARYRSALQRFADQNADHPLSSSALAVLAGSWRGDNELVKAHEIASQGMARFPKSAGGNQCFNTISEIEAKTLNVQAEKVWNSAGPEVEVSYRNIEQVHFRLVKYDFQNPNWGKQPSPIYMSLQQRLKVLSNPVIKQWSQDLPKTDDYRTKVEAITVPADVKSGCYILIASVDKNFAEKKNIVSMCEVWQSNLSVVMRNSSGDANVAGHVVDAITGEPIAGASVEVSAWVRQGRNSNEVKLPRASTDQAGFFSVPGRARSKHLVTIRHGDQVFGYHDGSYKRTQRRRDSQGTRTLFFTDRSIYRPGQTIQFKAVSVIFNQGTNEYRVAPNRGAVEVSFMDVNQQVIEKRNFQPNEFGSISGSFVAPSDRATGRMYLRSSGAAASFRVEEYKRPKFFVEVEKPDQAFRLQEQVSVTGQAKSYSGAPIDGAKVTWRVVRNVRFPDWWLWRCFWSPPLQGQPQEIANGELETDVDGSFKIDFEAIPDLAIDRESEPVFTYTVYADVTDTTGETRSDSQYIRVGYTSLQAKLDCEKWQTIDKPVKVSLDVSTLDGEGQQSEGTIKIFALKAPDELQRARLGRGGRSWTVTVSGSSAGEPDLSKINAWALGKVVAEQQVKTADDGKNDSEWKLDAGAYRAVFETTDKAGQVVKSELPILVIDEQGDSFATKVPHYFQPKSLTVEVGDQFQAFWGTGYKTGRAFVELEHRGKIIRSFWTDAGDTQSHIKQDVSEQLRGGFTIRLTFIHDNRAYVENHRVAVPWSNKKLQVKWEHFVSKLTPGGRETWTAVVTGPDAVKATAEMVATLYDASLDAFAPHQWSENLNVFYQDYSRWNLVFQNSMQNLQMIVADLYPSSKPVSVSYRRFKSEVPSINYGSNHFFSDLSGVVDGGFGGGSRFARSSGVVVREISKSNSLAAPMADRTENYSVADGAVPARLDHPWPAKVQLLMVTPLQAK